MHDDQQRQSRVPEPADKQLDAARRHKLCTAFMLGFRHCSIMRAATDDTQCCRWLSATQRSRPK